jgi:protocatechuate 3,4-dioxygenase beta subunit
MMRHLTLFLFAASLFAQGPAPARIEGRVVDQNGKPVAAAMVGVSTITARQQQTAASREDGSFVFEDLPPGSGYTAVAQKNGYLIGILGLQGSVGPNGAFSGAPPTFSLKPGETMTALLTLTAQGVVTGRVTTSEGDPVANVSVQVRQARYNLGFLETVTQGRADTDDRGIYRIIGLPRGRYYLVASRAGFQRAVMEPVIGQESQTTFYPGVATLDKAQPIDVAAGSETKIDLTMRHGGYYKLSATLVDASGAPLANYSIAPRRADIEQNSARVWPTDSAGHVEIPGLEPGEYFSDVNPRQRTEGVAVVRQRVRFTIGETDAAGVVLRIPGQGARLTGTVRPEEGELKLRINSDPQEGISASALASPDLLAILPDLFAFAAVAMPGTPSGEWKTGKLREDRTFELNGLDRGDYQLTLGGLPPGFYVKAMKQGDREVTHRPVAVPGEPIEVIVSAKGAEVSGKLAEGNRNVALWTEKEDEGSVLHGIHVTAGDRDGAFRFTGLPPGTYRIAGFADSEHGILWRFAFLNKFADDSPKVEVAEGAKVKADPPLIPAARFKEEFDKLP